MCECFPLEPTFIPWEPTADFVGYGLQSDPSLHQRLDERATRLTGREKGQVSDGTEEIRDWQRTGRPAVEDKAPGGKRMLLQRITPGTGAGPPRVCYKVQNAVRPILSPRKKRSRSSRLLIGRSKTPDSDASCDSFTTKRRVGILPIFFWEDFPFFNYVRIIVVAFVPQ